MDQIISPARAIDGIVTLPGDKSISHRYGMIAAIAEGESKISNYATGADCQSTLGCMQALGAKVERREDGITAITGGELQEPKGDLDAVSYTHLRAHET
jgi:3-phosphoshikimate 1-carboxyvinyltransferase